MIERLALMCLRESFAHTQLKRNSNTLFWKVFKRSNSVKYNSLRSKLETKAKKIHVCSQCPRLFLTIEQVLLCLSNIRKFLWKYVHFPLVKIQKDYIDIRIFDELQHKILKAISKLTVPKNEIVYSFIGSFFEDY